MLAAAVLVAPLLADASSGRDAPPVSATQVSPPPKLDPDQLVAATREILDAEVKVGRFSGAVLIAKDGKPIFTEAYGLADREKRTPNTIMTQFRYGSTGKLFTAVAIMQLVQAGKLDLKAPIATYLPDYPNKEIANKATVGNLLSHSGGAGDFFGPEFLEHQDELRNPRDYVALLGSRPPISSPGSKREYSNYGFMILGRIVEVVSGLPYDKYVEKNIFAPAGMTSSGFQPEAVKLPSRATGYLAVNGLFKPVTTQTLAEYRSIHGDGYEEYRGGPASGGYSTVEDFLRFGNALTSNKILSAEYFHIFTTGRVTLTGMGLSVSLLRGEKPK